MPRKEDYETIIKKADAVKIKFKKSYSFDASISNPLHFPFICCNKKFNKNLIKFTYLRCTVNSTCKCFGVKLRDKLKKIYGFLKVKFINIAIDLLYKKLLDLQ